MSNDYFESTSLTANTQAKAEDINTRTESIESGFEKLPAPHASAPTTKGFSEVLAITDGTARTHALNIGQLQDHGLVFDEDTGTADAYVVTLAPAITSYTLGQLILMKASANNTGASTLDVNSVGPTAIKTSIGGDLTADNIVANGLYILVYDGAYFQLLLSTTVAAGTLGDYIRKDGTIAFTGNQSLGTNDLTNVGAITATGAVATGALTASGSIINTGYDISTYSVTAYDSTQTNAFIPVLTRIDGGADADIAIEHRQGGAAPGDKKFQVANNGDVTATSFIGPLTGAVTGNADTATTAATVTTAAQPNITSVGTLTALAIDNGTLTVDNGSAVAGDTIAAFSSTETAQSVKCLIYGDGRIYSQHLDGGAVDAFVDANGVLIRDPSDARYKKDIENVPTGLEAVLKLNPVSFYWNDKINMGGGKMYGFIAQEVEKVIPEVVTEDATEDKFKGINFRGITSFLVKAVQEIYSLVRTNRNENSAQKLKIQKLEKQNEDLLKRVIALEERG